VSFRHVYWLILASLHIVALPILVLLSFKQRYKQSIPARFFLFNNSKPKDSDIWFHASSLGETIALSPLIEQFKDKNLFISSTTQTGFCRAGEYNIQRSYLPFETLLKFWIPRTKVLVVMEAELWLLLFSYAKIKGAKTVLINARISDRSLKSYKRFRWLYKKIFSQIDEVYAQSIIDKERLESLGATNVKVSGNIKLAQIPKVKTELLKPESLIITAASTHKGEEEGIIEAYLHFGKGKLVVVPRHPERFESIAKMMQKYANSSGKTFEKFSTTKELKADMILVDVMGELNSIYAITDITILGGAFVSIGGHNPLEPLYFANRIISGVEIFNQRPLFEAMKNVHFSSLEKLSKALEVALNSPIASLKQECDIDNIINSISKEMR